MRKAILVANQIIRQPDHRRRIDYVFVGSWPAHQNTYSHIKAAKLAFDQPVNGFWTSDHFGVVVDLEVGREKS
jgi:hypothetical protein